MAKLERLVFSRLDLLHLHIVVCLLKDIPP